MLNFLHNFPPTPVLLDIGLFKVYWYGLLVALATLLGFLIFFKLAKNSNLPEAKIFDLGFYLIIWGIIGARVWHVLFYNLDYFISSPLAIFKLWHGGLSIFGAIFAGLLAVVIYCRKHHLPFFGVLDVLAVTLPLSQAIGRWGNYFNQELFGLPCSRPWCIPIAEQLRPEQYLNFRYFHPVFLYESILNLALFFLLLLIFNSKQKHPGTVVLTYLFGYSAIRFGLEFWRLDVSDYLFLGLKWTQLLCLAVMVVVFIGLVKRKKIVYT